jgi:hypothetical protein
MITARNEEYGTSNQQRDRNDPAGPFPGSPGDRADGKVGAARVLQRRTSHEAGPGQVACAMGACLIAAGRGAANRPAEGG